MDIETNNLITPYEDVEKEIRKIFKEEETKQDKEYFLQEISRLIKELYRDLE